MKFLTDRHDIAKAINFKQYPVIRINLEDKDEYGIKGTKVCIDNGKFRDGSPYYLHATIRSYYGESGLHITQGGACLHASFGYSDIKEMLEWANAPIIKPDQDILVVMDMPSIRMANCVILHTSDRIDPHCSTPLRIVDSENDPT